MLMILLFIIAPLLGIPIYIFLYANSGNKKQNILYSLLIGLSLGIISYYFVPKIGYDLVRHQNVVYRLTNIDFKSFLIFTKNYDLEFIPLLYSYVISFMNNVDLLQFFIVSIGYSIILYILNDYKIQQNLNKLFFCIISFFIVIGFQHLYFISGLYFYIAIIIFSLIIYLDYIKNKNNKLCIILYIFTIFIHNAMFLPLVLIIIHKFLKNKFNFKTIFIILLIFFCSFLLINYFNQIFNNNITNSLMKMYGNYVENESQFKVYYSGVLYFLEIFKLGIIVLSIILLNKNKKINGFILTLSSMTLLMMTRSSVAIRYIMLVQLIGIIPIIDIFKSNKKEIKIIILILLILGSILYIVYYHSIFKLQNFGNLEYKFFDNIINIFNKN